MAICTELLCKLLKKEKEIPSCALVYVSPLYYRPCDLNFRDANNDHLNGTTTSTSIMYSYVLVWTWWLVEYSCTFSYLSWWSHSSSMPRKGCVHFSLVRCLSTQDLWLRPPLRSVAGMDGELCTDTAHLCSHPLNELDFAVNRVRIQVQAPSVKATRVTWFLNVIKYSLHLHPSAWFFFHLPQVNKLFCDIYGVSIMLLLLLVFYRTLKLFSVEYLKRLFEYKKEDLASVWLPSAVLIRLTHFGHPGSLLTF